MCNHPSRGYPASMKLLEKFKDIYPLRDFVTHRFKVEDAAAAMAQVQDLNSCILPIQYRRCPRYSRLVDRRSRLTAASRFAKVQAWL
jgi:hypothetical protein